jgi:hypothetical protein
MSTLNEREAALRRVLRSAAEAIEPSADGLQRIQSRLRPVPRSLPVAWAEAVWTEIVLRSPAGLRSACSRLADSIRQGLDRLTPGPGATGRGARSLRLLRPLAAMTAVFIVAAGAYVAFDAPQGFFPNSSSSPVGQGGNGPSGGNRGVSGATSPSDKGVAPMPGGLPGSVTEPNCSKSPAPKKSHSSTPPASPSAGSPSNSASPTQSDTPSPTTSPSPTPTVSDTVTPDPSSSVSSPPAGNPGDPTPPINGDSAPAGTGPRQVVSPSPSTTECGNADQTIRNRPQKVSVKADTPSTQPTASSSPDSIGASKLDD